jgi:hypothetical protein
MGSYDHTNRDVLKDRHTRYLRLVKLRSALALEDPAILAELLSEAEEAHSKWEAQGWNSHSWQDFYAHYLLGIPAYMEDPCGKLGGFC